MEKHILSIQQVKETDIIEYLAKLGYHPQKISRNDYWFLSPLRQEKTASFKVNRKLNVWYDFGIGNGGNFIDFGILFHRCTVAELLQKLRNNSLFPPPVLLPKKIQTHSMVSDSASISGDSIKNPVTNPSIRITDVREISDTFLLNYLRQRRINLSVASTFCKEVYFTLNDKNYRAIGFKNNAGGYEIRNAFFKGSSSPKYVTYFDNKADKLTVFEGFFDFLSYQTLVHNQQQELTNLPVRQTGFLILNSLSFFERSQLLMEKSRSVHLYFDNDTAGKACVAAALKRSNQYHDESHLYKGYNDLNDFLTGRKLVLKQSNGLRKLF